MKIHHHLQRPETFKPGAPYLRIEHAVVCKEPLVQTVSFVCYDPCPAFIIVRSGDGLRQRCPRAEFYNFQPACETVITQILNK
jgi:hypothetical protein